MCCTRLWSKIISFSLTLILGLLTANIFQNENSARKNEENIKPLNEIIYSGGGIGISSGCRGKSSNTSVDEKSLKTSKAKPVQIISKPKVNYTDLARQNNIQGTVTLRVAFTASGEIGDISMVSSLPYGLTEQAILAARAIKFKPAEKNGIPRTVIKQVQYNFTIY